MSGNSGRGSLWGERVAGAGTAARAAVPAPAPVPSPVELADTYQPWGREHDDADDVIELRQANGDWCQISRAYLVRVEGLGDRMVSLLCTSCAVVISGRNLGELRRLLRARQVDYIQEFDAARWPGRPAGAPLIERIEILTGEDGRTGAPDAS